MFRTRRGFGVGLTRRAAFFPVDFVGERWSRKPLKAGGEARPPELSAHFWHNVLSSKERKQYWKEKEQAAVASPACLYAGSEPGSEDEDTTVPSDSEVPTVSDGEPSDEGDADGGWGMELWTQEQLDKDIRRSEERLGAYSA